MLIVFLKIIFEKVDFEKKVSRRQQKHGKLPIRQRVDRMAKAVDPDQEQSNLS